MTAKKSDMPKFKFAPESKEESRTVTLDETKWALLEKYCGFVERKTGYRPTLDKVLDRLLDDLFGTDKAFRHSEGMIRAKKPAAKQKQEAANSTPASGMMNAPTTVTNESEIPSVVTKNSPSNNSVAPLASRPQVRSEQSTQTPNTGSAIHPAQPIRPNKPESQVLHNVQNSPSTPRPTPAIPQPLPERRS